MTAAGDGLRVRSRPEVSANSKKLSPLLTAGSRMLLVNGPVPADGYDWYEVRADNDLFGWVAAGKDGEDWIAPAAANCTDDLDESALWTVDPIDFFVCYGDTPVSVKVRWSSLEDGTDAEACRRARTQATTSTARRDPTGSLSPTPSSSRRLAHQLTSSRPRTGRSLTA